MDAILNWVLRGIFLLLGVGAGMWILGWLATAWRDAEERWPFRVALSMLLLAGVYTAGHARLLAEREQIEQGRQRYAQYGDPRRTEQRRADVRGWIMDCTGEPNHALALYRQRNGEVERTYPLGQAVANLIGGGQERNAEERDYTVEQLFAEQLREPRRFGELGELHAAGKSMRLTLCSEPTAQAWRLLRASGFPGSVVVQDVQTGGLVAYAATGGPKDPPLGVKRYAPPGSVFKLALAAVWWENGLPDNIPIPCPSRIWITNRASIGNFEGRARGTVIGPTEMLVPSCNTAAVWMANYMRDRLGKQAFIDAYRRFGFATYEKSAPRDSLKDFWATDSDAWADRMSPPVARVRISEQTGPSEWAQLSIGQGPIDATVVGISRFIQAIGNNGVMLKPTIEWKYAQNPEEGNRIMKAQTARKLQQAMLQVADRGTASGAWVPRMVGLRWDLGGKTGTAQIPGQPDDGWFAGLMFDAQGKPRYTVVVYLRGGGPGGRAPATIGAEMTRFMSTRGAPVPATREAE